MLKTYLYIPDDLNRQIEFLAKTQKKSKAAVIRQAISDGVKKQKQKYNPGIETFLKLAELGKKYPSHGPRDSSTRIDELLWGKDWSKDE